MKVKIIWINYVSKYIKKLCRSHLLMLQIYVSFHLTHFLKLQVTLHSSATISQTASIIREYKAPAHKKITFLKRKIIQNKNGTRGIRTHDQGIMSPLRYRCAIVPPTEVFTNFLYKFIIKIQKNQALYTVINSVVFDLIRLFWSSFVDGTTIQFDNSVPVLISALSRTMQLFNITYSPILQLFPTVELPINLTVGEILELPQIYEPRFVSQIFECSILKTPLNTSWIDCLYCAIVPISFQYSLTSKV